MPMWDGPEDAGGFEPFSGCCALVLAIPTLAVIAYGLRVTLCNTSDQTTPKSRAHIISRIVALAIVLAAVIALVMFVEQIETEPPNYSRIEDSLYLGGWVRKPPPGTRAVLNLCETADPYEAKTHMWEPIRDAEPAPDLAWLQRMVNWVQAHQQARVTTYVHCLNGISRSALVVTAYFMAVNHSTRDQALEYLRLKRPDVRPNPAFMKLLLEWEKVVLVQRGR